MKKIIIVVLAVAYLINFAINKSLDKTVGYDYDSTLSFSTPTFMAEKEEDPARRMDWELINGRLLPLEKKKYVAWTVPVFKFLGYTPIVVTTRPNVKAEQFAMHVYRHYGIQIEDVYMTRDKAAVLKARRTVIFFGDSDGDITEAMEAGVIPVRVRRSDDDMYKENYNVGQYGEWVLPLSAGHF